MDQQVDGRAEKGADDHQDCPDAQCCDEYTDYRSDDRCNRSCQIDQEQLLEKLRSAESADKETELDTDHDKNCVADPAANGQVLAQQFPARSGL